MYLCYKSVFLDTRVLIRKVDKDLKTEVDEMKKEGGEKEVGEDMDIEVEVVDEEVDKVAEVEEEEEVDKVVDVQGAFLSAPIGPLVGPRKNGLVSCYWSSSTAPQYSV